MSQSRIVRSTAQKIGTQTSSWRKGGSRTIAPNARKQWQNESHEEGPLQDFVGVDSVNEEFGCLPCKNEPQDGSTTTSPQPLVSQARKTVLWQPISRGASDSPRISCAASSSPNNISQDPIVQFREENTAENLLARYKTVESAIPALYHHYTQAKEKSWDRRSTLGIDRWRNSLMIFDDSMARFTCPIFVLEQVTALLAVSHQNTQGWAKYRAWRALQKDSTKLSLLKDMFPFHRQAAFLGWMHETLRRCPHPELQALAAPARILMIETSTLVNQLSHLRRPIRIEEGFERRYELTKVVASGPAFSKLVSTTTALWTMIRDSLNDSTFLSKPSQNATRRTLLQFLNHLDIASKIGARVAMTLKQVATRRLGCVDRQQNIFNSLHHHVKLVHTEIGFAASKIQQLYLNLVHDAISRRRKRPRGRFSIFAHQKSFVSRAADLENARQEMARIYYNDFLPLRTRRIELLLPNELDGQNRVAQQYWLYRVKENAGADPWGSAGLQLDDIANNLRQARCEHGRQSWGARRRRERAIEGIQKLERLHPSQSPKSTQYLRGLLGADQYEAHHSYNVLRAPRMRSVKPHRDQDSHRTSPRQATQLQNKSVKSSVQLLSLDEIYGKVKANSAWR